MSRDISYKHTYEYNGYKILTNILINNFSLQNKNVGYSLNMYVTKIYIMCFTWNRWDGCKNIVSDFIVGDFMVDTDIYM